MKREMQSEVSEELRNAISEARGMLRDFRLIQHETAELLEKKKTEIAFLANSKGREILEIVIRDILQTNIDQWNEWSLKARAEMEHTLDGLHQIHAKICEREEELAEIIANMKKVRERTSRNMQRLLLP